MKYEEMFKPALSDETEIVAEIAMRLKKKDRVCSDSNLVAELRQMTKEEILQAIS